MVEQGSNPGRRRLQFNLWWALGLSVLLHVVLAVLSNWAPAIHPVALAREPEDAVLRFSFAQSPDATAEEPALPKGEVPFQTPPPRPAADLSPPPVDPGAPVQPAPAATSEPRPVENEPVDEPAEEKTARDPADSAHSLPERPDAPIRSEQEPRERSERDFDLQGAIRDFGRVLEKSREASPNTQPGSGPPRNVFVPDPADLPTTGFGVGNLTFETRDFDWSDYARSIYWEIWRAWHNRLLRLASDFERWSYDTREPNLYHQVQIRFVIERTGEVTGIEIETPSGCLPLDESATQALEEVILPSLPDDFPKQREVVHARFLAQGEIRSLRPYLERLKYLNYF